MWAAMKSYGYLEAFPELRGEFADQVVDLQK
jgi:hypothetical protein